jgi:hypothetical protein
VPARSEIRLFAQQLTFGPTGVGSATAGQHAARLIAEDEITACKAVSGIIQTHALTRRWLTLAGATFFMTRNP